MDVAGEDSSSFCPSPRERLRELRAAGPVEVVAFHRHRPPEGEPTVHLPHTLQGLPVGPWVCSQWFPARFAVDGVTYPNAEVFMMVEKARLFGDHATLRELLGTTEPGRARELGREVRGYDEARWRQCAYAVVVSANQAKFGQDPALRGFLEDTGEAVLVEASPTDRVWGVGLPADDARVALPAAWRGTNHLGLALMEVRARLRGPGSGSA